MGVILKDPGKDEPAIADRLSIERIPPAKCGSTPSYHIHIPYNQDSETLAETWSASFFVLDLEGDLIINVESLSADEKETIRMNSFGSPALTPRFKVTPIRVLEMRSLHFPSISIRAAFNAVSASRK